MHNTDSAITHTLSEIAVHNTDVFITDPAFSWAKDGSVLITDTSELVVTTSGCVDHGPAIIPRLVQRNIAVTTADDATDP